MIDIEEVAERTYRLEALVPGVDNIFSVYLIQEDKGMLIEPGPATAIPSIQEGMKHLGMKDLAYIIPTHIHLDHAGGVGKLAHLFPQAKVVLHPEGAKHAVDPSRLIHSIRMTFGDDFEVRYGPILPVPESQVKIPTDGEIVSIGDRELQIIYAPGHASHHIAVFDQKVKGLFCGEALGMPKYGTESSLLPSAAPPGFDMEVCLETMERLRALRPQILFYSHDGLGKDPERLILVAAENTRIFGDIILKAMKEGEAPETISRRIQQYVSSHFGQKVEELDLGVTVSGYIFYFKKKGLA